MHHSKRNGTVRSSAVNEHLTRVDLNKLTSDKEHMNSVSECLFIGKPFGIVVVALAWIGVLVRLLGPARFASRRHIVHRLRRSSWQKISCVASKCVYNECGRGDDDLCFGPQFVVGCEEKSCVAWRKKDHDGGAGAAVRRSRKVLLMRRSRWRCCGEKIAKMCVSVSDEPNRGNRKTRPLLSRPTRTTVCFLPPTLDQLISQLVALVVIRIKLFSFS